MLLTMEKDTTVCSQCMFYDPDKQLCTYHRMKFSPNEDSCIDFHEAITLLNFQNKKDEKNN